MQDIQPAPTSLKRADLIATIKGLIAEREVFVATHPGHDDVPAFRADIERKRSLLALIDPPRVSTDHDRGHVHNCTGAVGASWFRSMFDYRYFIVLIGTSGLIAVTDDFGDLVGVTL
jgi:hypothetical protein